MGRLARCGFRRSGLDPDTGTEDANSAEQSRRGGDLTRYLPDLAPVLAARLPADAVIDG